MVGAFGEKTPWADKVTQTPPIARHTVGGAPLLVRGAIRNGENRWAMLVEHAARDIASGGAAK